MNYGIGEDEAKLAHHLLSKYHSKIANKLHKDGSNKALPHMRMALYHHNAAVKMGGKAPLSEATHNAWTKQLQV